jgi:hypothetical protein
MKISIVSWQAEEFTRGIRIFASCIVIYAHKIFIFVVLMLVRCSCAYSIYAKILNESSDGGMRKYGGAPR